MNNFIKPKMVRILNSLSIDMILIKKGTFMIGDKGEQKKVTIKNDFYMGKYLVTIAEYMHFIKDTKRDDSREWKEEPYNHPIAEISWEDAIAYCKWLSKKTKENYKLPTEKEWEYACRAGTKTKWSFGDDESELEKYAWYDDNSDRTTHIVGKKSPNPWGLYDMHGNVWEWCEDWYDEDKKEKVLRGGSWSYNAIGTRSSGRGWDDPDVRYNDVGFRLLRTLPSNLGDS